MILTYTLIQCRTYSKVGREGVGFNLKTTAQDIATPATALVAAQALAKIDPVEMVKEVKKLQPLAVEYNGKSFSSKGATIKMQPGDMAGVIQSTSDIPLMCGFDLKNTVEGDPITWRLETSNGTVLPLEAPLRTSASSKDTYLGIQWPDGQNSLKLSVVSGERSLHFTLLKPDWKVSGLQIADGGRVANAGETLYLVKAPLKDEKATVSWTSNIDPMLLNKHYFVNGTPSPLNLTAHKIPYSYSESPSKTTYRLNALGYDESVKVEVVDEDSEQNKFQITSETFGKAVKDALVFLESGENTAKFLDKIPFVKRMKNSKDKYDGKLGWYFNATAFEQTERNI